MVRKRLALHRRHTQFMALFQLPRHAPPHTLNTSSLHVLTSSSRDMLPLSIMTIKTTMSTSATSLGRAVTDTTIYLLDYHYCAMYLELVRRRNRPSEDAAEHLYRLAVQCYRHPNLGLQHMRTGLQTYEGMPEARRRELRELIAEMRA